MLHTSTPPLLAALRAGTRELHDRTEAAFVLGAPAVPRAVYAAVLLRLVGYYDRAECALAPWAPALAPLGLDLAVRRKAPLLQRDLAAVGGTCRDAGQDAETSPSPVIDGLPTALGVLYVLEGATLGGQLLRRRLGPALGLTPEAGLAFFSAYGADVGPMWRAFTAALDRFDQATPAESRAGVHATAVAGARAAFLAFERDVVAPTAHLAPAAPAEPAGQPQPAPSLVAA